MEQEFYYFTLDSPTSATALLYGDIGFGISANLFVNELTKVEALGVTDISIRISSLGGSVFDGFTIFQALQKSKAFITTYNDSVAASIAALIFLGGRKAVMCDFATLMIHNPWSSDNSAKGLEILSLLRQSIITILSKRTGQDKLKVAKLMDSEKWFDAEEALALGFATEITETESMTPQNFRETIKIYNSILKNNKKTATEDEELVVSAANEETATEAATEALEANPEADKVTVEVAEESAPNLTVEEGHIDVDTTQKIDISESVEDIVNPDLTPATTQEVTIKEVQEKIEIQAKLKELEITNKRLREDNQNIVTVNSDLTAKLAAAETALNKFKAEEAKKAEDAQNLKITNMVDAAIKAGKIAAIARNSWVDVAKTSYKTAEDALENMYAPKVANKAIDTIRNAASSSEKKVTLRDMEKSNPAEVERLYKEDRIAYNQLYFECYGKEPK